MDIELHPSTTDQLARIKIPVCVSDQGAMMLLRSCGEHWPSRLSISDSMTVFLEIETGVVDRGESYVLGFVRQLLNDLARSRILRESVRTELEGLVSAVIESSLGKRK